MVFQPLTALALLMAIGLAAFKFRFGRMVLLTATTLFLAFGFLPIGHNLLCYLENTYPSPHTLPKDIDGIIVLGGAVDSAMTYAHAQPQLNDNAERITEMVRLSRLYPQAKLVFTSGDASLDQSSGKESDALNILLKNIGFDASRIIFESQSRNTYENMVFSMRLVHPQAGEKWLLITSAFHIPRSVAIFNSNGWTVLPYPAGYLTDGKYTFLPAPDVLGNYYKLQVAVREFVGIIAYSLTERIKPYDEDNSSLPSVDQPSPATSSTR